MQLEKRFANHCNYRPQLDQLHPGGVDPIPVIQSHAGEKVRYLYLK